MFGKLILVAGWKLTWGCQPGSLDLSLWALLEAQSDWTSSKVSGFL